MFLNGKAVLSDFNTANADSLLVEVSLNLLQRTIRLVLHILIGPLIPKHIELFEYFGLFGLWSTADVDDLLDSEGAGAANDVADVVAFADVMDEQVSLWLFLLHLWAMRAIL